MNEDLALAQLRGAVKRYKSVVALDGVDLSVRRGELLSLLGHNGAGKTTAIRLLLGLSRPTAGSATIFGLDPHERMARSRVGALLQVSGLPAALTVREYVSLFSSYYPRPLPFERTLELSQLGTLANRRFGDLSGGQRQRVYFALALCGDPDLLVLDEPTVGLDVQSRHLIWGRIRDLVRAGKSVLLTTHYLEEADTLADRIAVLAHGKVIADGTPADIKARAQGTTVSCETVLDVATLRTLPGVDAARLADRHTELQTQSPDLVLRELYARDPALRLIDVSSVALEDAFLALTREAA